MIDNLLETGINQLSHPHPSIRARLQEHSISDCEHGCKIYHDPTTDTMVLHHNGTYGCRKTKAVLEKANHAAIFKGRNFWMVPLKEKVAQDVWDGLLYSTTTTAINEFSKGVRKPIQKITEGFQSLGESARKATEAMAKMPKPKSKAR